MRTIRVSVAAAMMLLAVNAVPASGQTQTGGFAGTFTGGTGFATTAAISLTYSWDSANGIAIFQLNVTNLGIYDEVYKAIGLINIPVKLNQVGPAGGYSNSPSTWTAPPPNDLSGLPAATWGWVSPNPAPTSGLLVGQTATFYFRITGITGLQVAQIGAGVHGISGPSGCSTKLGVLPDGSGGGTEVGTGPYTCTTVTPEPTTVALLAAGLLGLAGAARLRRREDLEVETEENADA